MTTTRPVRGPLWKPVALLVAGLALCGSLTSPATVQAASVSMEGGKVVRWQKSPVPYHLHPACSSDLQAAACLDEVRKSFAAWVGPACSSLTFMELGSSSNLKLIAVGYNENGKNELAWVENSAWSYGKYVLGVTSPLFYTSGKETAVIIEADIAFNGYQQTWSSSGKAYSTDVMNVAVHEIGHFFGLQHNLVPDNKLPQTMAPTADPFMGSRTPEQDDIDGLCFLYPKAGSVACTSNAQCPKVVDDGPSGEYYAGQIPCQGGVCAGAPTAVPQGNAKIGEGCASDNDCAKPLFCQPLSGSQAVCSQLCTPGTSGGCPTGFGCVAYQGSTTQGACLQDAGGGGSKGKAIGEPCQSSSECTSKLCVSSGGSATCLVPCTSGAQCPSGQSCQLFSGKSYGACADAPSGGGGSLLPDGSECTASGQCSSGLCVGSGSKGTCLGDCTTKPCAAGFACKKLSNGKSGCFETGDLKLGAACGEDLDCQGGLCVASGSKYVCSQPCGASAPCPNGTSCVAISGGAACLPAQQKVGVGGSCEASDDCQSGLCVVGTKGAICSQPCTKDAQCGGGWACAPLKGGGGACTKLGDGTSGKVCDSPFDCQSGECIDFGKGYVCATPCTGAVECACGEQCVDFSGESWCQAGKKVACVQDYGACQVASECVSDLCLGGKCAPSCSIFGGGATCETGKGCIRLQADKPEGTCSTKGPEGFAGPCGGDTACVSLFCDGGLCGKPCNPFGPNACPLGLVCEVAQGSVGACRTPKPAPADDIAAEDIAATDTGGGGAGGDPDAAGTVEDNAVASDSGAPGSDGAAGGGATVPVVQSPSGDDGGCQATSRRRSGAEGGALALLLALGLLGLRRTRKALALA